MSMFEDEIMYDILLNHYLYDLEDDEERSEKREYEETEDDEE